MGSSLYFTSMWMGLPLIELRDWLLLKSGVTGSKAWPLQGDPQLTGSTPFFILGSPRSGTTLLRAILQSHRDVFIPPENGTLGDMVKASALFRNKPWNQLVDAVFTEFVQGYEFDLWDLDIQALKAQAKTFPPERKNIASLISLVYENYGALHTPGKGIWGDKSTPGTFHHLYRLFLIFPQARYLHIIRDGRACVASSVKAGFYDKSFILAARAWQANVRACQRLGRRIADPKRFLEIHYEELVENPEPTISKVRQFLQIEDDTNMYSHSDTIKEQCPDITKRGHHENVAKPIFSESLKRWQRDIPSPALAHVQKILEKELHTLGYQ